MVRFTPWLPLIGQTGVTKSQILYDWLLSPLLLLLKFLKVLGR